MNDYLVQLMKMIKIGQEDADGILIVNKEGYIEYFKPCSDGADKRALRALKNEVGKHVLDLYPELNEENSTVMETLRTGKTIVSQKQTLTWNGHKMTIMSVTYPIMENGEIQGAADVAKFLDFAEKKSSKRMNKQLYVVNDILTQDAEMERLKERISRAGESESPVLIYGETGTGKQLVAESLHMSGCRWEKPFISQNCGAIPSALLESIFFGTEKGGFTGAETRKGIFEMANEGTLFLDEMNSMDVSTQVKLLKAIEEKEVRRIGGEQPIPFDVRIVCATNEDPEELVEMKRMRADLYYRIGVIKMEIPPLRKRIGDVKILTDRFILEYNKKMYRNISGLSHMTEQLFERWHWPGNVRELKNTIESAFNMEQSDWITIGSVQDLLKKVEHDSHDPQSQQTIPEQSGEIIFGKSLEMALEKGTINLKSMLEQYERYVLQAAMAQDGQLKKAAAKLSMSPQKLQYRMEKLGLRQKERI